MPRRASDCFHGSRCVPDVTPAAALTSTNSDMISRPYLLLESPLLHIVLSAAVSQRVFYCFT
jgi:hypothetical protein